MSVLEGRQGYLGNLEHKTKPELLELLERQEKLLKKRKFLLSLPDKGKNIQEFVSKLQELIKIKEEMETDTHSIDMLLENLSSSADRLHNEENFTSASKEMHSELMQTTINDSANKTKRNERVFSNGTDANSKEDQLYSSETVEEIENTVFHMFGKNERAQNSMKESIRTKVIDEENAEKSTDLLGDESLAKSFHGLLLDDVPGANPEDLYSKPTVYPKSYQIIMDHTRDENLRKTLFKPNSDLKVSEIEKLPEKYRGRNRVQQSCEPGYCSGAERSTSSATGFSELFPKYLHDKAKSISIEESIQLQRKQTATQKMLQAKKAAERLASRFNVAMDTYDPKNTD